MSNKENFELIKRDLRLKEKLKAFKETHKPEPYRRDTA